MQITSLFIMVLVTMEEHQMVVYLEPPVYIKSYRNVFGYSKQSIKNIYEANRLSNRKS